jgi:hypothetical protein
MYPQLYACATPLCKANQYVCQKGISVFKIPGGSWPAINELKKGFFVSFGDRD